MTTPARKIIHAHIYDPSNTVFKPDGNARAKLSRIHCSHSDQCDLHAKGQCIVRGVFARCPHGSESWETGWTRRARKYHKWVNEAKAKVADVPRLACPPLKMARVGDYMYLPYGHMNMYREGLWTNSFLPREHFTVEMIVALVEFRPRTYGGEILSYQREKVPAFVRHLKELYPDMLAEAMRRSEHVWGMVDAITFVGRKALLRTVLPNVGTFKDMRRGAQAWVWDGTYMTCADKSDMPPFTPFDAAEMRILPGPDAVVTITDDAQVNEDTVFAN